MACGRMAPGASGTFSAVPVSTVETFVPFIAHENHVAFNGRGRQLFSTGDQQVAQ